MTDTRLRDLETDVRDVARTLTAILGFLTPRLPKDVEQEAANADRARMRAIAARLAEPRGPGVQEDLIERAREIGKRLDGITRDPEYHTDTVAYAFALVRDLAAQPAPAPDPRAHLSRCTQCGLTVDTTGLAPVGQINPHEINKTGMYAPPAPDAAGEQGE